MTPKQGKFVYDLILEHGLEDILELGSAHGTGACYMAAALDERQRGKVITIDMKSAENRNPNVRELSERCELSSYIQPIYAHSTYNWELMKMIQKKTKDGICTPMFDLCYLDGAHNFEIDCCAFFLVDKLLKPNGFIIFDDVYWTYGNSPSLKHTDKILNMAEDERSLPHIEKLVELIVMPHPHYHQGWIYEDWFITRKKSDAHLDPPKEVDMHQMILNNMTSENTIVQDLKGIVKKLYKRSYLSRK